MNQVDQKTYWGLGEVVMWLRTRDYELVATVGDLSETQAMVGAMFTFKTRMDSRSLAHFATTNCDADREAATPPNKDKAARVEVPVPMPPKD